MILYMHVEAKIFRISCEKITNISLNFCKNLADILSRHMVDLVDMC